jgi:hypothetical protein
LARPQCISRETEAAQTGRAVNLAAVLLASARGADRTAFTAFCQLQPTTQFGDNPSFNGKQSYYALSARAVKGLSHALWQPNDVPALSCLRRRELSALLQQYSRLHFSKAVYTKNIN